MHMGLPPIIPPPVPSNSVYSRAPNPSLSFWDMQVPVGELALFEENSNVEIVMEIIESLKDNSPCEMVRTLLFSFLFPFVYI